MITDQWVLRDMQMDSGKIKELLAENDRLKAQIKDIVDVHVRDNEAAIEEYNNLLEVIASLHREIVELRKDLAAHKEVIESLHQEIERLDKENATTTMLASEKVLQRDWDCPEEDEAWGKLYGANQETDLDTSPFGGPDNNWDH